MCRELVKKATRLGFLRQLAVDLGPKWKNHLNELTGKGSAERQIARLHALTRTEPIDENFTFGDMQTETRLSASLPQRSSTIGHSSPVPFFGMIFS